MTTCTEIDRSAPSDRYLESEIAERRLRPTGDRRADYRTFALSCEGKRLGTARLWLLPTSKLAAVEVAGPGGAPSPEVDALHARLAVTGYRP